jgi:hypothetical protein
VSRSAFQLFPSLLAQAAGFDSAAPVQPVATNSSFTTATPRTTGLSPPGPACADQVLPPSPEVSATSTSVASGFSALASTTMSSPWRAEASMPS